MASCDGIRYSSRCSCSLLFIAEINLYSFFNYCMSAIATLLNIIVGIESGHKIYVWFGEARLHCISKHLTKALQASQSLATPDN